MRKSLGVMVFLLVFCLTASNSIALPIPLEWTTHTAYLTAEYGSGVKNYGSNTLTSLYPPYLSYREVASYSPSGAWILGDNGIGNPEYSDHWGNVGETNLRSNVFASMRSTSESQEMGWFGYINAWTESLAISEAFTGMTSFSISFQYDNSYSLNAGNTIPNSLVDFSPFGKMAFGLLDLTTKKRVGYRELNFSGSTSGSYYGSWDTLNPSHYYDYYLLNLAGVNIDFNHLILNDFGYPASYGAQAQTDIYAINAVATPEPSTLLLLGSGLVGLLGFRRKFKK